MTPTIFQSVLVGLATGILAPVLAADPVVTLPDTNIAYRGTTTSADSIEHFLNIRFAHDTSGPRRFAPPELYTPPSNSVIDATVPGPACPQSKPGLPPFFVDTPNISEDCLNLRISRPAGTTPSDKLPVVVHIHGGGVVKGSAYDPHFDPDNLLSLSSELGQPIIYVALNYRLTIFGFPRLPILKDQNSLNLGLRDQRAGLEWVRDNIAAFGGDPERVTAFGLSSGGTFSSIHLVSYAGEKGVPFTRAWMMSGPPGTALNMSSEVTEAHTRAVAEEVGCGGEEKGDQEVLDCLRAVPFEELTEKAMAYSVQNHPPAGLFTFIPSVDGDFLPERQSVLYRSGRFVKDVPLVLAWAEADGDLNAGPAPLYQAEADIRTTIQTSFAHALTDADYETLFSLYPVSDFEVDVNSYDARRNENDPVVSVHYFRASRILRDLLFTCSSIDFARASTYYTRLDGHDSNVRLYALNQSVLTSLFRGAGMPYVGNAVHGSDTPYLFNGVYPEGEISEEDKALSRQFAGAFVRFAHGGNPEGERKGEAFDAWPEAFTKSPTEGEVVGQEKDESVRFLVVGGPFGTRSYKVNAESEDQEYGEMGSKEAGEGEKVLEAEKLIERCRFINSLSEKLGN
ncbi:Alpha/Beta hydrolase protein [Chaetomium sp. MPI-SDFR-AT-0129]|nr:Alpha/Beta hydrolase protein [Chaetomium sp. MPI-SDFR-AT-0129]